MLRLRRNFPLPRNRNPNPNPNPNRNPSPNPNPDQVPHAPLPPAARDLECAATLDKGYGQVYCLAVHGANLFCGLRSGHVQLWHCPLNAPPGKTQP